MYEQEQFDAPPIPQSRTNVLGIVGFILSFCVSPLGLLLSLIALFRPPRGFAIAGTIIGLLGTIGWGVIGFFVWFVSPMIALTTEAVTDYIEIRDAIASYQAANNGALPDDLSVLALSSGVETDPWGTPYRYEKTGDSTWTITVAGPDQTFDDGEDATLHSTMSEMDVGNAIGEAFGESVMRDRMGSP